MVTKDRIVKWVASCNAHMGNGTFGVNRIYNHAQAVIFLYRLFNGKITLNKSKSPLVHGKQHQRAYDVMIADGSRYSTVLSTHAKNTEVKRSFLVLAMTSMIREFDAKAADDILKFWFRKDTDKDQEKGGLLRFSVCH